MSESPFHISFYVAQQNHIIHKYIRDGKRTHFALARRIQATRSTDGFQRLLQSAEHVAGCL